ncbi:hypothetical protein ACFL20_12920 [Spirochaetota bacterium]
MKMFFCLIIILIFSIPSCKKKVKKNLVDIKQIEIDGSTNDRYLFRNDIKRQEWLKNRYKKEKF